MVWLMGAGLVAGLALILGVLSMILSHGAGTFWPRPIEHLTLSSGKSILGIRVDHETPASTFVGASGSDQDQGSRTLFRVGNKDLGQDAFRWIPDAEIQSTKRPADAVLLEREAWSVWIGIPRQIVELRERTLSPTEAAAPGEHAERQLIATLPDGSQKFRERRVLADGPAEVLAKFEALHQQSRSQRQRADRITRRDLGDINRRMENVRLRVREAELDLARATQAGSHTAALTRPLFWLGLVAVLGMGFVWVRMGLKPRKIRSTVRNSSIRAALGCALGAVALLLWLEHPALGPGMSQARFDAVRADAQAQTARLQADYDRVLAEVRRLEADAGTLRLVVLDDTSGRFAPVSQSSPNEPLMLADVVRLVQPNTLSLAGKVGIYLSRWKEFLLTEPRDANNDGGVFPVIFGTVLMTMLLSIIVVPLGVIAALYLREYAKQGPLVSIIRIAVNNLAGVPSIVYGVFGYGFLCLTVGKYIDAGTETPSSRPLWWAGVATLVIALLSAAILTAMAQSTRSAGSRTILGRVLGCCWIAAAALFAWLIWSTPYFTGFFEAKLPNPTFGKGGVLWASITLALLTLPVVIVATEEAIAAVPRSVREGSYGCGASKWQTIRRIVLPQAMPGIMTGAILAMARGAGEVAPLMLVGAVKLAPELPLSTQAPFLHPERSFMHLGFHIYDLGFQSSDADAARPLVWTTTLLLVAIVLILNLVAVTIRSRLRARNISSAV
jgi:phosphate transport system permease protein